jgi:hypothetical protein
MAALDAAIQEESKSQNVGMDGRVKPGHDEGSACAILRNI